MTSRLSYLSKLNLLGLIDLSIIASELKINKGSDIEKAVKYCEESIQSLSFINKDNSEVGIASQNLIEELYDNLIQVKEKDLDVQKISSAGDLSNSKILVSSSNLSPSKS